MHQLKTRQGLMPFPRVGRGGDSMWDLPERQDKRNGDTGTNSGTAGLWFGPRLGRLQKRSDGVLVEVPWGLIAIKGTFLLT